MSEEEKSNEEELENSSSSENSSSTSVKEEPASEAKVEKKEETAEDLLGANIEQVKVRKAKGSKNISSEFVMLLRPSITPKFHLPI